MTTTDPTTGPATGPTTGPTTDAPAVLDDLLASRWSCRAFRPDPVPEATIDEILLAAGRSPSWCNTQPWHAHLVTGAATDRLRAAMADGIARGVYEPDVPFPPSYEGVYRDRRRVSGWQLYEALGVERGDREASGREMLRNFDLFGAPHAVVLTTTASLGTYGALDCGLFVQSFLLAAQARGVATIAQAALAGQAPVLRDLLDLPEDRQVLVGISFGYAEEEHPSASYRTERQGLDELVTRVEV
ncbi:nitroreductase [Nocardioides alkalitolerans]|uniref:nitroreductase n=1 Tax=Nocardioides alkalitolerans TaxID=281714 RepID=UPI0006946F14|nr:nitroreductase [Nocardioides alkalitolerans]